MNLLLKQARIIDPASHTDGIRDILIQNGEITAIDKNLSNMDNIPVLDASGLTAFPGLTDIHCHFRDPGWPEKETIESGSQAALAGGVTTVVCMANTKPVTDNPETIQYILNKASSLPIQLLQNSAMTLGLKGQELVNAKEMLDAGACGFSDDGIPIANPKVMEQALCAVADNHAILSVHEELPQLLFSSGVNYGKISRTVGVGGASDIAESALIERDIQLQSKFGGHLHFQHVSTARSLQLIREAKLAGQQITAEVTPQHLALTDEAILTSGANAKINPPLRSEEDRQALLQGVVDGTIDVIVTDHAPHTVSEKEKGLQSAPSGMIGLETSLSIAFTTLVTSGLISRLRLAELMCCKGAELYGLHKAIAVGEKANLTLFDENKIWIPEHFYSKSTNTPFLGQTLTGKVMYTICNDTLYNYTDTNKNQPKM